MSWISRDESRAQLQDSCHVALALHKFFFNLLGEYAQEIGGSCSLKCLLHRLFGLFVCFLDKE